MRFDNDPAAKVRPEQGLQKIKNLVLCSLRPLVMFDSLADRSPLKSDRIEGVDFVCVRELTGGIYLVNRGRSEDGNVAFDSCVYSRKEVERILKIGFELAQKRKAPYSCR